MSRTVPRTRRGSGAVTSSSDRVSAEPSHAIALRPIASVVASRETAERPRSVSVQRDAPGP